MFTDDENDSGVDEDSVEDEDGESDEDTADEEIENVSSAHANSSSLNWKTNLRKKAELAFYKVIEKNLVIENWVRNSIFFKIWWK